MRFMMFMIPRVYQPDTPAGERAGEGFAPPAEEGDVIEIRQVFEMSDFSDDVQKAANNPTVQKDIHLF
jgi:hypothetical protein